MRNEYPSFNELVQFRNQYTIAKNLHIPGIVQPLSLETYGNGYTLVMEDFTVSTSISQDKNSVLIRIQDNGVGMSEQVRQKIFDHLFTTKAVGKGTKLGLSIARQIVVEKHRGTLEVNSTPGLGAEFVITIPA